MRYFFDDFIFDAADLRLEGPQGELALRPMSARVLQSLLEEAPGLLRHDELLDRVWGRQAVTPGVLSHSIREIRGVLGDSARESRYIETRHRLGYCFIAPVRAQDSQIESRPQADVSVVAEVEREPPASTPQQSASTPIRQPVRYRVLVAIAVVLALAWVVVFWGLGRERNSGPASVSGSGWIAGQPQEPEALQWYLQGVQALQRGDLLQAQSWLERSRGREPDAVATLVTLADRATHAGDRLQARAWIAAAETAGRTLPRVEQLRIAARQAALDYRWDTAIAHWTAVSQLDPGDADSAFELFDAQLASGRPGEAERTLDTLAQVPTVIVDHWRLAMARARLAGARGDPNARLAAAESALDQAGDEMRRHRSRIEQAWARFGLGQPDAARALLAQLPSEAGEGFPEIDRLRADELQATLLREAGDYAAAREWLEQAAVRAETAGLADSTLRLRRLTALVQVHAGEIEPAIETLHAVIDALSAHDSQRELASAQDVLSLALQRRGDMAGALAASEAALAAQIRAGDRLGAAGVRNQLGMLYGRAGRNDEAREQFESGLQVFEAAGDRRGLAVAQSNLAILDGRAGRREAARERSEIALAAFRDLGSWPEVARLQFNLAVQDRGSGQLLDAEARFQESLEAFERIGSTDHARQARASLAELALARADPAAAQALLGDENADALGSPQARAAVLTARGRLAALRGDLEGADSAYRAALLLRQDAGLPDWARMSALDLATLAANRGRLAQAEQGARQLRQEMTEAKDTYAAIQAGLLLGAMLERQQQAASAIHLLEQLQVELAQHPDAMQGLQLDLLRAVLRGEARVELALEVARAARTVGYELLALRADLIAGGNAARQAKITLDRQGIRTEGMPPLLPY